MIATDKSVHNLVNGLPPADLLAVAAAIPGIGTKTLSKIWQAEQRGAGILRRLWRRPGCGQQLQLLTAAQSQAWQAWNGQQNLIHVLQTWQRQGYKWLTKSSPKFPVLLHEISTTPAILFYIGSWPSNWQQAIAVVGSRHPSEYGQLVTKQIVSQLVAADNNLIVSGGMYGIDMLAHETCLAAGGQTVAFLGHGFNHWYPKILKNKILELAKQGLTLVSEYAPPTQPTRGNFVQRNRLVAGSTWSTIITQAAEKSGTLHTANLAAEYGRDVFIVPGPITEPQSVGLIHLWQQGAMPIIDGWQVNAQRFHQTTANLTGIQNQSAATDKLISYLRQGINEVEDLALATSWSAADLLAKLTQLELLGLVKMEMGKYILAN